MFSQREPSKTDTMSKCSASETKVFKDQTKLSDLIWELKKETIACNFEWCVGKKVQAQKLC